MPKTTIIHKETDLTDVHTFGVPWQTRYFVSVSKEKELPELVLFTKEKKLNIFVLGGGSNILPTKKFNGIVIQNSILGVDIVRETKTHTYISVGAGENWDALVRLTIKHGYPGFENLSLIPGTVGGAVVQNIGAYDVDIARFVASVDAYSLKTGTHKKFLQKECSFKYRSSVFKDNNRWIVTRVVYKLPKKFVPVLTYKGLQHLVGQTKLTPKIVAKTVVAERNKKLPNPNVVGTAGSFFKNPRVSKTAAAKIQKEFPNVPLFKNYGSKNFTIPAGWLIQESIDAKTKKDFLYPKHNLVVVNTQKGNPQNPKRGAEINRATQKIQRAVYKKFGIQLVPEVIIL